MNVITSMIIDNVIVFLSFINKTSPILQVSLSTNITQYSMIFKIIRQSLEDVYIAERKINELNNLRLNATNITAYATALKGLN